MNDESELANFITADEKTALPPLMDETENFLYSGDEGVYDKKFLENKCEKFIKICDAIYGRFNQWKNLDQAVQFMDEFNGVNMNKINQLSDSSLKKFINAEELFNLVSASNKNINDLKADLVKSPKYNNYNWEYDPVKLRDRICS